MASLSAHELRAAVLFAHSCVELEALTGKLLAAIADLDADRAYALACRVAFEAHYLAWIESRVSRPMRAFVAAAMQRPEKG